MLKNKIVNLKFSSLKGFSSNLNEIIGVLEFGLIITLRNKYSPDEMRYFAEELVKLNCIYFISRGVQSDDMENYIDFAIEQKYVEEEVDWENKSFNALMTISTQESIKWCIKCHLEKFDIFDGHIVIATEIST